MDWQAISSAAASLWVVWFFLLFGAVIVWVYWPKRRKKLESHGQIPLRDDDERK